MFEMLFRYGRLWISEETGLKKTNAQPMLNWLKRKSDVDINSLRVRVWVRVYKNTEIQNENNT